MVVTKQLCPSVALKHENDDFLLLCAVGSHGSFCNFSIKLQCASSTEALCRTSGGHMQIMAQRLT